MKAVLCTEWGTPDNLAVNTIPSPQVGPNQIRVRVEAAGVNFADLVMIAGHYQVKPPLPFVPGMEFAGQDYKSSSNAVSSAARPGSCSTSICS